MANVSDVEDMKRDITFFCMTATKWAPFSGGVSLSVGIDDQCYFCG